MWKISYAVCNKKEENFYLFIDEVQYTTKVIDEENGGITVTIYDMLNELKSYRNLDVYVTGSNSKGLSNDIATEFRGRATQIHVDPLSFAEYYSYVGGDERNEYYVAAEPPVRRGESHLSGQTEPPCY